VYYDNVKIPSLEIDKAQYTYNTGTMLQSNVLLYEITKKEKYLAEARRLANAANSRFYQASRFPDDYWFNAVMLRGFIALYNIDKDKDLLKNFISAAEYVWEKERDENNLVGKKTAKGLIDQAAMMEVYARLEQLGN
ncbi:MAG TPA: glycoside hydrolase family 76 protein, partial [Ignavibacteriales bacterium]|nr:glycoside hydrolase family 76 protein [Ignavibacteriales bacterium]